MVRLPSGDSTRPADQIRVASKHTLDPWQKGTEQDLGELAALLAEQQKQLDSIGTGTGGGIEGPYSFQVTGTVDDIIGVVYSVLADAPVSDYVDAANLSGTTVVVGNTVVMLAYVDGATTTYTIIANSSGVSGGTSYPVEGTVTETDGILLVDIDGDSFTCTNSTGMYLLINDVVLVALTGIDTGVAIALIYRPGVSDPYPPIPPVSVPSGYPNATDFPELGYPYVSSNNATVSGSEELAYVTDSASARVWVSCGATYNNGTTLTPTALAPNTPIKWTDPNSSLYGSVTTPSTATVGFVYTGGVVYTWSDFLIFLAYDATNQKFRYMVWDYSTSAWFAASDLYAPTAPTNYATRDQTVYGGAANEALYDASGYPVFFQTWTPAAGTTSISTVKIRSVFWRPTIVGGLPYGTMLQQENTVTVTPTNVTAGSSWACKITTQGLRKGYGGWAAVGGNGNASAPTTIYYGQIIAQIDYGWSATQTFSPVTSFALSGNAWTALMFTAAWSFTGSTPARTDSSGRIYQVRTDPALISRWQMVRTSPNGAVETWNFLEGTIQLSSVGAEGYLNFTTANAIYNGDFVVATSGVVYIPVVKMLTGWVASFYEATEITANATKRYKHQVEILAVSGTTVDTVWTSPVRAFARTASSTSLLSNILAWYQISQGLGTAPNMGTSGGGYGKYLFIRAGNSQRNTYLRFITAELPVNGDGDLIAASTFNSPTTDNFNTINIA